MSRNRQTRTFRPTFDVLEDRCLPAVVATPSLIDPTAPGGTEARFDGDPATLRAVLRNAVAGTPSDGEVLEFTASDSRPAAPGPRPDRCRRPGRRRPRQGAVRHSPRLRRIPGVVRGRPRPGGAAGWGARSHGAGG